MNRKERDFNDMKGEILIHFKGKEYLAIDKVIDATTGEEYILYRALYGDCNYYVRPYKMFMSEVDKHKYPNCKQMYRFEVKHLYA